MIIENKTKKRLKIKIINFIGGDEEDITEFDLGHNQGMNHSTDVDKIEIKEIKLK